jgi:hypothetical protein
VDFLNSPKLCVKNALEFSTSSLGAHPDFNNLAVFG